MIGWSGNLLILRFRRAVLRIPEDSKPRGNTAKFEGRTI